MYKLCGLVVSCQICKFQSTLAVVEANPCLFYQIIQIAALFSRFTITYLTEMERAILPLVKSTLDIQMDATAELLHLFS